MPPSAPPNDLSAWQPRIVATVSGVRWWRSHECALGAVYFGRGAAYRFDDPLKLFGTLYAGYDQHAAFMESIGRKYLRTRLVPESVLTIRCYSALEVTRRLRLIDITGPGLAHIGAEASLTAGRGYRRSQQWSRALHEHPVHADGLLYRCRHDPSRKAVVLFDDRCSGDVQAVAPPARWLDDPGLLGAILDRYKLDLG